MDVRAPIFYYDLGSPECYLAAERVSFVLGMAPEWEPVRGRWDAGPESDAAAPRHEPLAQRPALLEDGALPDLGPAPDRGEVERLARERGVQTIRWPRHWPPDSGAAMRAATYAKSIGRGAAFSLAAFRQAFAAGRDLGNVETVLIAAAACEMHPAAVRGAIERRSVARALEEATARAVASGVRRLPAVRVGELILCTDQRLDEARAALLAQR